MNISVFGLGYVGCVSVGCLAVNGHNVIGVDINHNKVNLINAGKPTIIEKDIGEIIQKQFERNAISATINSVDAVLKTELSIIAVGTPSTEYGHLNLNYIFDVAKEIGKALISKEDKHMIAIRSTVLPGTCDEIARIIEKVSGKKRNVNFSLISNPEFLREGTAVNDYFNPPLTLIGSDHYDSAVIMSQLYKTLPGEIIITSLRVAEIMKYVNNTFHALKVSFANEIGNICSALQIDSHEVMDIFCRDKQLNISNYYFKPGFAYGGSCLPKDLKGLQTLAHDLYVKAPLLESLNISNENQIQRAILILENYSTKKLGFLGLSFKEGTDDLRNSPGVRVIEAMLGKGAKIQIYDRNISLTMLTGTNKDYIEKRIPHLSQLLIPDLKDLIENVDVIIINTKEPEFYDHISTIEDKIIIDFVRLNEALLTKKNYTGINWGSQSMSMQKFISKEDTVLS